MKDNFSCDLPFACDFFACTDNCPFYGDCFACFNQGSKFCKDCCYFEENENQMKEVK